LLKLLLLQYLTTLIPYDPKTVPPNIEYLQIYVKSSTVFAVNFSVAVTSYVYDYVNSSA